MRYNFLNPVPATAPAVTPTAPEVLSVTTPVAATIKTATHTKRQCPIWIVQLSARVERKEFTRLSALAKKHDGYYSSYGAVELHGFIFFAESAAAAFATLINGQPTALPAPPTTNIIPLPRPSTLDPRPSTVAPMPEWRARLLRRPLNV